MDEKTRFAPAGRASAERIGAQALFLRRDTQIQALFQAVNDVILVLNQERQIVFYNRNLLDTLGLKEGAVVNGLRPGEIFGCIHAAENSLGCGTTEFCQECGAVHAILAAQAGKTAVRECRILRQDADALDLLVKASPFPVGDETFTIFSVRDVSHEKRRKALERIFFHDVLNAAGGIQGLSELMPQVPQDHWNQIVELLQTSAEALVGEIVTQRELTEAENNELVVHRQEVSLREPLDTVLAIYRNHPVSEEKVLDSDPGEGSLTTDPVLLARVLGNLVKNALEASSPGQKVLVGSRAHGKSAVFEVRNPGFIPVEVQHQLFQRSFSTKGPDRGLGTYSVKLLTERYLGGRVDFTSTEAEGTVFRVTLPR